MLLQLVWVDNNVMKHNYVQSLYGTLIWFQFKDLLQNIANGASLCNVELG